MPFSVASGTPGIYIYTHIHMDILQLFDVELFFKLLKFRFCFQMVQVIWAKLKIRQIFFVHMFETNVKKVLHT